MQRQIILVTHDDIGSRILQMAKETLSNQDLPVHCVSVSSQSNYQNDTHDELTKIVNQYENDDILILADLYGATPCNIARPFQDKNHIRVIAGLNLSMLLKSLNYINTESSLNTLVSKAIDGGIAGIKECKQND